MTAAGETSLSGALLLERYELGELLGEGGMGQVYRARDQRLDREVAVKVLHGARRVVSGAVERFLREAKASARLRHPNLIRIYDAGATEDFRFLVMELLAGEDLFERLWDAPPPSPDEAIAILSQIAEGMAAAHSLGLVHRDLKPENVMMLAGDELRCKVVDFGMAIDTRDEASLSRLTKDGAIAGTPLYMAPEALKGAEPAPPADVYAFGCVAYHVLCGQPPFAGDAVGQIAAAHLYAPVPSLREKRLDCPAVLDELVTRCLSKEAARRPSMEQVRDRLLALRERSSDETRCGSTRESSVSGGETAAFEGERLLVYGDLPMELRVALGSDGIELVDSFASEGPGEVLLAVGADDSQLRNWVAAGHLVITQVDARDPSAVLDMLRLGAFDSVSLPLDPRRVLGKVQRALASSRRRWHKE